MSKITMRLVKSALLALPLFWLTHRLWMPLIFKYLNVGERPQHTDAIVIPGGSPYKVISGIELYKNGYAPRIVISGDHFDLDRSPQILREQNVPESDVASIRGATNTWNEAQYNLDYLHDNNLKKVLIITDPPHTRRLRAVYNSLNTHPEIDIAVVSSERGDANSWWKTSEIRNFVFREYIKIVFYFVRYGIWSF